MINNNKCLAVIPARGGSKRLKRKNIKLFNGKPLIAWSILEAKKSKFIDSIIVSTEDQEIADIAIKYGALVPYLRPNYLSEDNISAIEPIFDLLKNYHDFSQVVLLQPTSPLRLFTEIDECIKISVSNKGKPCVSISQLVHNPEVLVLQKDDGTISRYNYKNKNIFKINGAIYTSSVKRLKKSKSFMTKDTISYKMPIDRSVDIDTLQEFNLAENIMKIDKSHAIK